MSTTNFEMHKKISKIVEKRFKNFVNLLINSGQSLFTFRQHIITKKRDNPLISSNQHNRLAVATQNTKQIPL